MGIRNIIKSNTPKLRMINVILNGTVATPVVGGFDQSQVKEVIDLGVGQYTVVFKYAFNVVNPVSPMAQVTSLTAQVTARVMASAHDRVTVECYDMAGAPAECDLNLSVTGCDGRLKY